MSAALLLAWRQEGLLPESTEMFERIAAAFPARVRLMPNNRKDSASLEGCVWTHEAARSGGFADDKRTRSWLTIIGNPARADLAALDGASLLDTLLAECLREGPSALASLSPPFVVVFFDGRRDEVHICVDRCGLQHLYLFEQRNGTLWLSSSSLALASELSPRVDLDGVAEWLAATHFLSQRTFFRGIRKLSCGEHLVLGRKGAVSAGTWLPTMRLFSGEPESALLESFHESLRACIAADGLSSELTGGVDSRLVLATLLADDVPFFAWTLGNPGSVELRTIERLRRTIPFQHLAVDVPPSFVDRLPALVAEKHELGDGEENALEYAPLLIAFEELAGRRRTSISGVPGELFRGFYFRVLRARGPKTRGVPVDSLVRAVTRDSRSLQHTLRPDFYPDPETPIRSVIEEFLATSPARNPEGLLEDFYLRVRMQRFTGRGTTTTGLFCRHALPYFGNEVVDLALSLPYAVKSEGKVIRKALMRLSPELAAVPRESGIPIAPSSWRRPDLLVRTNIALAKKAAMRYGGRLGNTLVAAPPEAVPWSAARSSPVFRDFVGDLLLSSKSRINSVLEPSRTATVVERAFSGGSLFPLGLLLTLALTFERISHSRVQD